ncbi:hypothetical protein B0H15DRAFT_957810 [Mycena belliarum]|uniref:Uncharacterized protein n=1 Tax=Mycena belliarum TaxID=1033014 RepID=A0AAD6TQE2_9AGAR|nr:hypothetical protein B0H15DRAFT_957810 [Mycena belliae]
MPPATFRSFGDVPSPGPSSVHKEHEAMPQTEPLSVKSWAPNEARAQNPRTPQMSVKTSSIRALRSRSITSSTPAVPAAPTPVSAPPAEIAVSGYPDRPSTGPGAKGKASIKGLHFKNKGAGNTYTASSVKGRNVASVDNDPSSNSFALIAPDDDSISEAESSLDERLNSSTVEENMTAFLIGTGPPSFATTSGGDISSSDPEPATTPDAIKLLARRLSQRPPRPDTPPGTTSGAGSSTVDSMDTSSPPAPSPPPKAPELGCAQNPDGSLREAHEIVFYNDPDDDMPLPAAPLADALSTAPAMETEADAAVHDPIYGPTPFLAPIATSPSAAPAPAPPIGQEASPVIEPQPAVATNTSPIPPPNPQAGASGTEPFTASETSFPPIVPAEKVAPPPAPSPAIPTSSSFAAVVAAPAPPRMTTRSLGQAARRLAEGPAPKSSPFVPLPRGMFIPKPAPSPLRPQPPPEIQQPPMAAPQRTSGERQAAPQAPQPPPAAGQPAAPQPAIALQAPLDAPDVPLAAPQPAVPQPPPAAQPTPPAGPALSVPASAASPLNVTPASVFCHIPLDMPGIYSPDVLTTRENISPRQLARWEALVGGKFLVFEWDGKPHSIDSNSVEDIKSGIERITGGASPLVGPAEPATPGKSGTPYVYLVRGVSDADTLLLLSGRVWNLVGGTTFFAIPFEPPSHPFLFTLEGFTFKVGEGVEVADTVVAEIADNDTAKAFLAINHDNYPAGVDPMTHFAASVRVTPFTTATAGGTHLRVSWNVTATPPSLDAATNRAWVSLLSALKYRSDMHYVGSAVSPPLFCSRCKSPGHVHGSCPLPKLEGWHQKPGAPAAAPSAGPPRAPRQQPANRAPRNNNGGGRNRNGGRGN